MPDPTTNHHHLGEMSSFVSTSLPQNDRVDTTCAPAHDEQTCYTYTRKTSQSTAPQTTHPVSYTTTAVETDSSAPDRPRVNPALQDHFNIRTTSNLENLEGDADILGHHARADLVDRPSCRRPSGTRSCSVPSPATDHPLVSPHVVNSSSVAVGLSISSTRAAALDATPHHSGPHANTDMQLATGGAHHRHHAVSAEELVENFKDSLVAQLERDLVTHGETLTVMCIGESGAGKTTLISSLFVQPIPRRSVHTKSTQDIVESVVDLVMGQDDATVNVQVRIIDSPGYGDNVDIEASFRRISEYIEGLFDKVLELESKEERPDYTELDRLAGVDAILYFIAPHRLKRLDIEFLRRVHLLAPVLPIISKADTLTTEELAMFRRDVTDTLTREGIEVYAGPFAVICCAVSTATESPLNGMVMDDETDKVVMALPPLSSSSSSMSATRRAMTTKMTLITGGGVRSSSPCSGRNGVGGTRRLMDGQSGTAVRREEIVRYSRGRHYPWGIALADNPEHSDLPLLRATLLSDGLLGLHRARRRCFERYRRERVAAARLRCARMGTQVGRFVRWTLRAAIHAAVGMYIVLHVRDRLALTMDEDEQDKDQRENRLNGSLWRPGASSGGDSRQKRSEDRGQSSSTRSKGTTASGRSGKEGVDAHVGRRRGLFGRAVRD